MADFCENFVQFATKKSLTGKELKLIRLRCKMWNCEYCAAKNGSIWRAHIIDRLNKLDCASWCFVTLTAHKRARTTLTSVKNLKSAWDKLYHRLHRKYGEFEYVMVYEKHKNLAMHIHAIMSIELGGDNVYDKRNKLFKHMSFTNWLKNNMAEVGAGFMAHGVKIDAPNAGLVSAYITKYMTKQLGEIDFPKYARRIVVSRGFGSPKFEAKEDGWKPGGAISYAEFRLSQCDYIVDLNTGERVDSTYFKNNKRYPPELT